MPALVDVHNPGLTGGVQNQPDFQAGSVDHRTHFVSEVPRFARQAMQEFAALTGREYGPIKTFMCEDAETVMLGLGSVTDDAEAVATYLARARQEGRRDLDQAAAAVPGGRSRRRARGKKAVTVLERSDVTALTGMVTQALFKARENADGVRHPGIPAIETLPKITTAIFGLGAHDLQPRHLVAAFKNMEDRQRSVRLSRLAILRQEPLAARRRVAGKAQGGLSRNRADGARDRAEPEPACPQSAFRVRFHSVGGYGTIATGKLLTDILAGVLDLHSKAAPKYGSEKSGAPTNYYITLSPEPVMLTNAELEDVEIVVSPDHKVFSHSNPLRGLVEGGTFILQSQLAPLEAWRELPASGAQDHPRQEDPVSSSSTPSTSPSGMRRRRSSKPA